MRVLDSAAERHWQRGGFFERGKVSRLGLSRDSDSPALGFPIVQSARLNANSTAASSCSPNERPPNKYFPTDAVPANQKREPDRDRGDQHHRDHARLHRHRRECLAGLVGGLFQ